MKQPTKETYVFGERVQVLDDASHTWVDAMVDDYCYDIVVCVFPEKEIGSPGWKIDRTMGVDIRKHPEGFSIVPPRVVDAPHIREIAELLTMRGTAEGVMVPTQEELAAQRIEAERIFARSRGQ